MCSRALDTCAAVRGVERVVKTERRVGQDTVLVDAFALRRLSITRPMGIKTGHFRKQDLATNPCNSDIDLTRMAYEIARRLPSSRISSNLAVNIPPFSASLAR